MAENLRVAPTREAKIAGTIFRAAGLIVILILCGHAAATNATAAGIDFLLALLSAWYSNLMAALAAPWPAIPAKGAWLERVTDVPTLIATALLVGYVVFNVTH